MNVGSKVICSPQTLCVTDYKVAAPMRGTVIWVHPKGRFVRVAFDFPHKLNCHRIVESFFTQDVRCAGRQ